MKRSIQILVSSVVGSLLTISLLYIFGVLPPEKKVKIQQLSSMPAVHQVTNDIAGATPPFDFAETAEKVMPSVVQITSSVADTDPLIRRYERRRSPDPFRDFFFDDDFFDQFFYPYRSPQQEPEQTERYRRSTGSGVIINEDGYIVTNNHVIDNADEVEVTLHDNRSFKATVIGTDPTTDLALLKIKASQLPTLPLVDSDEVKVGEWVLAVGNPLNLNSTVTAGIVSAKGRNINILREEYAVESFIQTDAAINPGNSGGALVNLHGGLVGINTAIASPTGSYAGYGFAVPSNLVRKVVEDLLEYGNVQRGVLGVMIRDVNSQLVKDKDLEVNRGVYVDSVMTESSAHDAGIEEGDVILEVNGTHVYTSPALQELIAQHRPGDEVKIKVDRYGKEKVFDVQLKSREGLTALKETEADEYLRELGAVLRPVDKEKAKKLDIEGGVQVVKLHAGKLRSHTRMREGFIITHVDKKAVKNLDDFSEALQEAKGGALLQGIYEDESGIHYYGLGIDA
ncbi:Do family serine endopeptidase [Porifericola rhodea]|uniref:Do family serine endopeptidase n=1 Tax=Porifericola rhodea TaxID=930972 RepID=UPI002666AE91|nr:Do family serine endopeptidase [Porifericola rhodea]WKN29889.1 Do family serine endopeptidase [Porifericola rhodea]